MAASASPAEAADVSSNGDGGAGAARRRRCPRTPDDRRRDALDRRHSALPRRLRARAPRPHRSATRRRSPSRPHASAGATRVPPRALRGTAARRRLVQLHRHRRRQPHDRPRPTPSSRSPASARPGRTARTAGAGVCRTPASYRLSAPMRVGVPKETRPASAAWRSCPTSCASSSAKGIEVLVEPGAGAGALIPDDAVRGRRRAAERRRRGAPTSSSRSRRRAPRRSRGSAPTRVLIGFLEPLGKPETRRARSRDAGVTAFAMEAIPRISPRAGDGRAVVAVQRRRLQGGAARRRALRRASTRC